MKVSVVIPTYNRRDQVIAAIRSALDQSFPVHEVIVVDDCSSDDTIRHVASTFAGDSRVRPMMMVTNRGACYARNAGVEAAEGEWIAFLDSDDLWDPEKLSLQMAEIERNPSAIACFCGMTAYRDDRVSYVMTPPAPFAESDLYVRNTLGSTSNAVIRADALRAIGGFDPKMPSCQDWDLYLRVAGYGAIATVPYPLVRYSEGRHARISNTQTKVVAGHQEMFARILQRVSDPGRKLELAAEHAFLLVNIRIKLHGRVFSGVGLGALAFAQHPRLISFGLFRQTLFTIAWELKQRLLERRRR